MVNPDFSPLREGTKSTPGRKSPTMAKNPSFKEKPGFNTGVPGKAQPKDRSNGIKRLKIHPTSEGL